MNKETYYIDGKVRVIIAAEDTNFETEPFDFNTKAEAVQWLNEKLTDKSSGYCVADENISVEECRHYTSIYDYHLIAAIVESDDEEVALLKEIYSERRDNSED